MKIFFKIILIAICVSCSENSKVYLEDNQYCPQEIAEKKYCDLYNKAMWYFYASNSHNKFEYRINWGKLITLEDVLSIELELYKWKEFNDTIEFTFVPAKKYELTFFYQRVKFGSFGFNKKNRKLIYKVASQVHGKSFIERERNGYIFYTGDRFALLVDSICKNSPSGYSMRDLGIYPINEDDSILISKIKSGRNDINPWLINYAMNFRTR